MTRRIPPTSKSALAAVVPRLGCARAASCAPTTIDATPRIRKKAARA
jgi:hypothetical protein